MLTSNIKFKNFNITKIKKIKNFKKKCGLRKLNY